MKRLLALMLLAPAGCDLASTALVDNQFPDTYTVERLWWQVTLFDHPVPPASSSDRQRTVPGTAIVWAILSTPSVPQIAVRSVGEVTLETRGDELHLVASPSALTGICALNAPLTLDDAEHATRIFPDELGGAYDPATCTYAGNPDAGALDVGPAAQPR